MKRYWRGKFQSATALLCVGLVCQTAQAHNSAVHQDLTDLAYEVMRAVETGLIVPPPPPGVAQAEWNTFLADIKAAPGKLRLRPTGLPAPKQAVCSEVFYGVSNNPGVGWSQKLQMKDVPFPVAPDYTVSNTCGVRLKFTADGKFDGIWAPEGWYSNVIVSNPIANRGHSPAPDYTGNILGLWAANVDNEFDDSHIWMRPTSAGGVGVAKAFMDDAWQKAFGVLLLPFVCLVDLFAGNPGNCAIDSFDAADKLNVVKQLDGTLPGINDSNSSDYTGMWHFIKMSGDRHNEYDDVQGLYYEDAGPASVTGMDVVDLGIIIAAETAGMSDHYDAAQGIKRYQIANGGDFHANTKMRNLVDWQHLTFPHVPFEPVDNLALFGWKKFRDDQSHPTNGLGWPLHALGDAMVPMHVGGTSAWGHRPFEDAAENMWRALIKGDDPAAQKAEATAILYKAFAWRKMVQQYRQNHPSLGMDVPVRDLVTSLAAHTAAYADSTQASQNWPYNGGTSMAYLVDLSGTSLTKANAISFYTNFPNAVSLYQPILDDGVGAILAFLMSASEVL